MFITTACKLYCAFVKSCCCYFLLNSTPLPSSGRPSRLAFRIAILLELLKLVRILTVALLNQSVLHSCTLPCNFFNFLIYLIYLLIYLFIYFLIFNFLCKHSVGVLLCTTSKSDCILILLFWLCAVCLLMQFSLVMSVLLVYDDLVHAVWPCHVCTTSM